MNNLDKGISQVFPCLIILICLAVQEHFLKINYNAFQFILMAIVLFLTTLMVGSYLDYMGDNKNKKKSEAKRSKRKTRQRNENDS